ncbi:MAG: pyridoxal 5'-phosphate synthase glutaminase subunit PdxT [Chloroflexi bacterium]|nr:MAG: pyridoxal 5'-phosphate synthase glutaminase subunit PdxT [Chloroflexota bacterium]TMD54972.1 MAG: pyridoxal 5'-phosphate synthase glutaminase subunit PdxT [Chloroflexota bacterium]
MVTDSPLIGVLALQGAFREHVRAFEAAGARTRLVRLKEDLEDLEGLVIPGGESTTMTMLMERMGLYDAVADALHSGLPALGTCAGMILLAERVSDGIDGQQGLGVLDIAVRRNAYGRQLESFEAELELNGDGASFPGVFIRAPIVEDVGSTEVIARHDGRPVGVRKGRTMALAFHPELSGDLRLHREFLRLVRS